GLLVSIEAPRRVATTTARPNATAPCVPAPRSLRPARRSRRSDLPPCVRRCQHGRSADPLACARERVFLRLSILRHRRVRDQPLHPIYARDGRDFGASGLLLFFIDGTARPTPRRR